MCNVFINNITCTHTICIPATKINIVKTNYYGMKHKKYTKSECTMNDVFVILNFAVFRDLKKT